MRLTLCICCMSKYVLHIPRVKFIDGQLVSILLESTTLALEIAKQIDSCYFVDAVGYYDGRLFDEKLMVVFSDIDVGEMFRKVCEKYHDLLCQEEYAYEKDNDLIKFKIG